VSRVSAGSSARDELIAPRERALQTDDVVIDLREGFLIGDAILLELGLIGLQLRDRLDQPPFPVEDVELELCIAQLHQRLTPGHSVPGLRKYPLHAAAFEGIQVYGVERHDGSA